MSPSPRKLDIYNHVLPRVVTDRMQALSPQKGDIVKRVTSIRVLPDYPTEKKSKYEIWQVLGWPYETSVAMARIVFSGMLDKLPDMKIVTHHLGAMIPYFEGRVGPLFDQLGTRTTDEDYGALLKSMAKRPIEYFRMFYGDTAVGGSRAANECGLKFFGPDKV